MSVSPRPCLTFTLFQGTFDDIIGEKLATADRYRQEGNQAFVAGNNHDAIRKYHHAGMYLKGQFDSRH